MNIKLFVKYFIFLSAVALLASSCKTTPTPGQPSPAAIYNYNKIYKVGEKNLRVEIADTPNKMAEGLSGRQNLNDNEAMLFDFKNEKVLPKFCMKGMNFNLDLIYLYSFFAWLLLF